MRDPRQPEPGQDPLSIIPSWILIGVSMGFELISRLLSTLCTSSVFDLLMTAFVVISFGFILTFYWAMRRQHFTIRVLGVSQRPRFWSMGLNIVGWGLLWGAVCTSGLHAICSVWIRCTASQSILITTPITAIASGANHCGRLATYSIALINRTNQICLDNMVNTNQPHIQLRISAKQSPLGIHIIDIRAE